MSMSPCKIHRPTPRPRAFRCSNPTGVVFWGYINQGIMDGVSWSVGRYYDGAGSVIPLLPFKKLTYDIPKRERKENSIDFTAKEGGNLLLEWFRHLAL